MPQDPNAYVPVREPLTDEQVQALDAVDKYELIQSLVTDLVNKYMATATRELSPDEVLLLADYRRWLKTPKSASGVFHYRKS